MADKLDLRSIFGNALGNVAQSLGYGGMQNPIMPKRKNGPPPVTPMPSQQAHQDIGQGIQDKLQGILTGRGNGTPWTPPMMGQQPPVMSMPVRNGGMMGGSGVVLPSLGMAENDLYSMHANGGRLDRQKINIVGEEGPEAVVGDQVIPLPRLIPSEHTSTAQAGMPDGQEQTMHSDMGQHSGAEFNPLQDAEDNVLADMQIKPSPWKDLGASLVQGANNFFNKKDEPIRTWGEIKRDKKLAKDLPIQQQLRGIRDAKTAAELKAAQIANIYADNDYNKAVLKDREDARADKTKTTALGQVSKLRYYDPNNPVHSKLASTAGLDPSELQGWDDRNPVLKQVAGTTYNLNRSTGQFEPTNLPKDETKTLTDYEVEMPNGEKRKYRVSQRDAANFSTQMSALGAKLSQSQKQFDAKLGFDKEKEAALNTARNAGLDLRRQALQLRQSGDTRGADRLEQQSKAFQARMMQRVKEGKLTQEEYNQYFADDADLGSGAGADQQP